MARITRFTENDLARIVKRVIMEQGLSAGNAVKRGSSASNSTPRKTTPPPVRTTTPPLKTIVYTDPSLTKTLTNIDIAPNSISLVSKDVIFTYRVAGANTKSYMGRFKCSSNNQIILNGNSGNNSPSFISSKRAATLKSKCGVNQGYASTNTGVDTTLA